MNFVGGIIEKVLERLEQQRTETAAAGVCILKPITFQYHHKEILREVLGVLGRITTSADESKNRPPIDAAKLAECSMGFLLFALEPAPETIRLQRVVTNAPGLTVPSFALAE